MKTIIPDFRAKRANELRSICYLIVWVAATLVALDTAPVLAANSLDKQIELDIPVNTRLEDALIEWGVKAGMTVMINTLAVDLKLTRGVRGNLNARQALHELLLGSGLSYEEDGQRIIVIKAEATQRPTMHYSEGSLSAVEPSTNSSDATGSSGGGASAKPDDRYQESQKKLDVVLVTAERRDERLQDVPIPVTVLNTDSLVEQNQNRLQDYYASVPGLNLNSGGQGNTNISIRGLSSGASTTPTVGVTIDGVPFGSSTSLGAGSQFYPDIDPSDLARIEVLRGPQGTLYGASSIGGLIKVVTADPSTEGVTGRAQVLGNYIRDGDWGYGVRGALNIPLSDTIAMRASAFTRRDPGYIVNVTTGQRNVNEVDVAGGRFALLWHPSQSFSLKLTAMLQNTNGYGTTSVDTGRSLDPILGNSKQTALPGTGGYSLRLALYTAIIEAKLGNIDFQSISGYGINRTYQLSDTTGYFGGFAQQVFPEASGASQTNIPVNYKYTQEFQLSSSVGKTFDWLAGAFYTRETNPYSQAIYANDLNTGATDGLLAYFDFPTWFEEYALFADLTVHFTDKFDIQIGGRESKNRQSYNETDSGPFVPLAEGVPSPFTYPTERTSNSAFTYLFTPRYRISPDLMVYARLASGYRVGGPNYSAAVFNLPLKFSPDKTTNYELGMKGSLADHKVTFDVSAYYISWKNVQINLVEPVSQFGYFANAGDAKSQGVELSLQTYPTKGLTVSAAVSVNDAELTQNLPPSSTAFGNEGDPLPYSSRFSSYVSVKQDIDITRDVTGFIGGAVSYVGQRYGEFSTTSPSARYRFPAYAQVDLHAGALWKSWSVALFANNVTNKRGALQAWPYAGVEEPRAELNTIFIQPLTVGLWVTNQF